ncbi:MAG: PqqD family protein [Armatimonadetes bacterium]|nr:PqqD family protein [Armatimonadota bacterium]
MTIDLKTRLVRDESLMTAPIDEEMVVLSLATDHYCGLDQVGRRIWELLAEPHEVGELCRKLSVEYAATPEEIASDVLPFLADIEAEGLVHVAEG